MTKLFPIVVMLVVWCVSSPNALAKRRAHRVGKATTVTGCLQKGDEANEYKLSADGKTYGLFATGNVNLAGHVGHKVTVTGSHTNEPRETKSKTGMAEESMHLNVTNLKHVSNTCP